MKARLIIIAQVCENYGFPDWDGQGKCPEHWKFKGGITFEVKVDSMDIMYAEDECVEVAKQMLAEKTTDAMKYEYLNHEVKFGDDVMLDEDIFNDKLHKLCAAKRA